VRAGDPHDSRRDAGPTRGEEVRDGCSVRGEERNFHRPSEVGSLGRTLFSRFVGARLRGG
jgi:hypothetical protein